MIADLKPYAAMKDSGVPWLGEVPEHWDVRRLGRFGMLTKGNGASKEDEVPEGVPCVRYGDLYTQYRFFIDRNRSCVSPERATAYTPIQYGDVLFAASGETIEEIGKSAVNLMTVPAVCGGDVLRFRPAIPVDARFMGYACDCPSSVAQKSLMGRGFTVVHIYGSQLKALSLALPPLREQTAIARFLDHADRRIRRYIRAKEKLIKLIEEQKQAIIHRAVTRGLDPNVRLKPSGVEWLGDVPEHWDVVSVGGACTYISYGFTNPMPGADDGPFMLTANDIGDSRIRYETARRTTQEAFDHSLTSKSRPICGDILVTKDGTLGRVAVYDGQVACINQSVALLRPDLRQVLADYLSLTLRAPLYQERMRFDAGGTTIKHIYISRLAKMKFALPPIDEEAAIVRSVEKSTSRLHHAVSTADREISLLREYRTRLIADVVTGKLDVREAAVRLPEEVEELEPLDETEVVVEGEDEASEDLDIGPDSADA